jgi:hypothetical protein
MLQRAFSRLATMRHLATFALALALGSAATVGLVACGGGEDAKLLPGTTAQQITENLDAVQQLSDEGECVGAANAAQEVSTEVEELGGVDAKLKQSLQAGAARLNEVVAGCDETTTEAVAPAAEAPSSEEELPAGQEAKEEKEGEKEEKQLEKDEEKEEKEVPSGPKTTPTETTPAEPPATEPPSGEAGGTGAPGGVSPGTPATPGGE